MSHFPFARSDLCMYAVCRQVEKNYNGMTLAAVQHGTCAHIKLVEWATLCVKEVQLSPYPYPLYVPSSKHNNFCNFCFLLTSTKHCAGPCRQQVFFQSSSPSKFFSFLLHYREAPVQSAVLKLHHLSAPPLSAMSRTQEAQNFNSKILLHTTFADLKSLSIQYLCSPPTSLPSSLLIKLPFIIMHTNTFIAFSRPLGLHQSPHHIVSC